MITSSGDNTLKMWIFDMPDSGARLLRLVYYIIKLRSMHVCAVLILVVRPHCVFSLLRPLIPFF